MEASCDERSLALLGEEHKAGYARSLIDLSTALQGPLHRRIAFSESSLRLRVMNVIRYRPLSPAKRAMVAGLILVIGLVTATNPLHAPDIYIPRRYPVSVQAASGMEDAAATLVQVLADDSPEGLLAISQRPDSYYFPLYADLADSPWRVEAQKLYPQTEELAYCYLTLEDGAQVVAVIENGELAALQAKSELVAGEISPDQIYLEPGEIAQAARDYFVLEDYICKWDDGRLFDPNFVTRKFRQPLEQKNFQRSGSTICATRMSRPH